MQVHSFHTRAKTDKYTAECGNTATTYFTLQVVVSLNYHKFSPFAFRYLKYTLLSGCKHTLSVPTPHTHCIHASHMTHSYLHNLLSEGQTVH